MDFLPLKLQEYIENHTEDEDQVLKDLEKETWQKVLMPRMVSGKLQGKVLEMFSKMIQPSSILEIGTFTGYSAICLAKGLKPNGKLITIDNNLELEEMVKKYISLSEMENTIIPKIGNAMDIIPQLNGNFDIVFIDADKNNYSNYYDLIFDKVPSGGYIIADNVLWSGNVLDANRKDEDTLAIISFNKKIQEDNRVENVLFTIRDGLMVIRKK